MPIDEFQSISNLLIGLGKGRGVLVKFPINITLKFEWSSVNLCETCYFQYEIKRREIGYNDYERKDKNKVLERIFFQLESEKVILYSLKNCYC